MHRAKFDPRTTNKNPCSSVDRALAQHGQSVGSIPRTIGTGSGDAYLCNDSTWKMETEGLGVQGHLGLHVSQASLG